MTDEDKENRPKSRGKELSRREFMGSAASAAVAGSVGLHTGCGRLQPAPDEPPKEESPRSEKTGRSTVVLVRDERVLDSESKPDSKILARMLDQAVSELVGKPADQAWETLVSPEDTVGIKSNIWPFLPTPKALEQAIEKRLRGVGVPANRISVSDRGVRDDPVFQSATALINVRPIRTHDWSGLGTCIKNYITFSPVPFTWHMDSCANLGGLWELEEVKGKTRLNILVALTPLFHGKGPHHFNAAYTWPYKGLIAGKDPVAVDATAWRLIQAKRKAHFGKDAPLSVPPKHIWVAEHKYHLGISDPERIDVKKIGWMKDALI